MKTIIRLIVFVLISISYSNAQNLDSLITEYTQNGKAKGIRGNFNGVVLIAQDNEIVFNKAYGYSNFETKTKLTEHSTFLVGSVTKPIVAFLVMQQVEKGTINLDQPITDFLPYLNTEKNKKITVHDLLSHTSGMSHYNGINPFFKSRDDFFYADMTPKEYALLIDKAGLESVPGTHYSYSSLGYILLGAILEEATKKPFSDLIKEHIANPLQLNHFGFGDNAYLESNVVPSYQFKNNVYKVIPNRSQTNTYTTGGVHANILDLFHWTQALKKYRLLSESYTNKLLEPNLQGYAYGWIRNDSEVLRYLPHAQFYAHGGRVNGFSCYVMLNDDGTTIIVLANTLPLQPWKLIRDIYRCYNKEDLQKPTRVIVPSLKSIEKFNEEGGMDGLIHYKTTLSKSAGYPIYPSANYLSKFLKLYHQDFSTDEMNDLMQNMIIGNPNAEDLINRLAYDYVKIDIATAEQYFKKGVEMFPKSANAWDSLGEFYEKTGAILKAKKMYSKAVALAKQYYLKNLDVYETNLNRVK